MVSAELVHRYPRLQTWSIELLCTVIVLLSTINLGAAVLRYLWDIFGMDTTLSRWIPALVDIIGWLDSIANRQQAGALTNLLAPLGWTAVVLLAAVLLRNAFPIVRSGSRGLLIGFAGDWLPIGWEDLHAVKVTTDGSTERFVLLVQSQKQRLTNWHRFYSLLYNFRWRRGFLITSNISDFEQVVRTMLSESERTVRASERTQHLRLDEEEQSLLFRLLLSPLSFFSGSTTSAADSEPVTTTTSVSGVEPAVGTYPQRITSVFTWSAAILTGLMIWRYLVYWAQFLVLEIPPLRDIPPFNRVLSQAAFADIQNYYASGPVPFLGVPGLPNLPAPWWLLIAAHLMIVLVLGVVAILRNMLPALEVRRDGLAVQVKSGWLPAPPRWQVVPWGHITAVKATEFSEDNQMLLLQTRSQSLPASYRFPGLLYDGKFTPAVLVTSAMHNFEPVMQRVLTAVTQQPHATNTSAMDDEEDGVLQQEAESTILRLIFRPGVTIDQLVEQLRVDINTKDLGSGEWRRGLAPMLFLSLIPAAFLLIDTLFIRGWAPGLGLIFGVLLLWFISMLEWPLVALVSVLLDESTGGGEEGYRAFPLYPIVQIPRLLPMLAALALLIVGVPVVPLLGWIGAIFFSFFLAAALWEKLYGWKGSQAILGGLIPVLWQFLVLFAYAIVQR